MHRTFADTYLQNGTLHGVLIHIIYDEAVAIQQQTEAIYVRYMDDNKKQKGISSGWQFAYESGRSWGALSPVTRPTN